MINILVDGVKVSRKVRRICTKVTGFYGYVKLNGKEVRVTKSRGKGNRAWTIA